jgi:hypothetical protein
MEKAGKRVMQVFPAYDLSFNSTPPALLGLVAHQIKTDPELPWINPFREFLAAAEDIRDFYRHLSQIDFENTLLRKWIIESLMAAARVHWALIVQPPEGTEEHVDDVDKSLRWLISWVPAFFPERKEPYRFQATEAANSLTCLGLSLLQHNRIESGIACATALASLSKTSIGIPPEPYALADLHQRLEILARGSETLGLAETTVKIRELVQLPKSVDDTNQPHFLEARETRYSQLDRNLRERRRPYGVGDDPIFVLQGISAGPPNASADEAAEEKVIRRVDRRE